MKESLNAVIDELKALRKEGTDHVYVSDEAMRGLQASLASVNASPAIDPKEEAARALAAIPDRIRSASPEEFDQILKDDPVVPTTHKSLLSTSPFRTPPVVTLPEGDKRTRWEALKSQVFECPVCIKHSPERAQVAFGFGDLDADIFFCGEGPGEEEEQKGEPFVGDAGQLLTKMIKAMGFDREQVYLSNIMNWRSLSPTGDGKRSPTIEEMKFCLPYLKAQVEIVKPKLIVALGVSASKGLLGAEAFRSLREIKGTWLDFEGIPVLPTYHPSYLLRNDSKRDKRGAWEDLLKVMERCEVLISEKQRGFFL